LLSGGESVNSGKRCRCINIQLIVDTIGFVNEKPFAVELRKNTKFYREFLDFTKIFTAISDLD